MSSFTRQFPRGQFFFHYTTREAAFEHILPDGQLRLSPYSRVNDPLENQGWEIGGGYVSEPGGSDPRRPERDFGDFRRHASEIWDAAKLLALTVDAPEGHYLGTAEPFGRGWGRARMWDQYAERHQGVCLLFDRERLIDNLTQGLRERVGVAPYHREVRYSPEGPAESSVFIDLSKWPNGIGPEEVREFVEQHHDDLFFLKTRDWQTEYEYRFVVTSSEEEYVTVDYGDALAAVMVGDKFPPWQEAGAITAAERAGALPMRIEWSSQRPLPTSLQA